MNILFVGDLNEHARSFQRFNAIKDLGYDVVGLSCVPLENHRKKSRGVLYAWRTTHQKFLHKLGFPNDAAGINKRLVDFANNHSVDLIWVEKGLMIKPATLNKIAKLNPNSLMVSYTEDDMFNPVNQSYYYRKSLSIYDLVVTTKSYNTDDKELPAMGARRVYFVDKAYDRRFHRPISVGVADKERYGAEVGFVGTFEKDRAEKMLYLAKKGVEVRIWGNGWFSWVNKHKNLRVEGRAVYNEEYIKALCATKINLCFLRKINRDLQTDRSIEIPACGAFMLAERTEEHKRLFIEDEEAAYFDIGNNDELFEKVSYYLNNDEEREKIAVAGRRRCIESGYSHHDRLKQILRTVYSEDNNIR